MQYSLKTTEEDETMLVAEDILNAVCPYSYVVIALFWASHHMCFYYGVTFDAKTQKNLCEKFDSEVLTYNQQRIFLLLPNVCVVRRFFIYILYSSLCVCYGNESMDN